MRHMGKRLGALMLALLLTLGLAACGGGVSEKDVTVYIQGEMDAYYHGQYNEDYLKLMEYSEADAKKFYDGNVEAEAERLLTFMDVQYVDDNVQAAAEEVVRQIYAKSKFSVGDTNKLKDGNFTTEVIVEPIEMMHLITEEDIQEIFYNICVAAGYDSYEKLEALQNSDMNAYNQLEIEYANQVLARVTECISQITYGTAQSVMLQMKLDDDNNYILEDNGWQTMDGYIIDYNSYYMS